MLNASVVCSVFSDEVFSSTDLARRTKDVLNTAKNRPVTVSRERDQFALMDRQTLSVWMSELNTLKELVNVLSELGKVASGESPSETYEWLTIFEKDDLHRMSTEILEAARLAMIGRAGWVHIRSLIHEWEESAYVAQSGVLDRAMFSVEAHILLPEPSNEASELKEDHCVEEEIFA